MRIRVLAAAIDGLPLEGVGADDARTVEHVRDARGGEGGAVGGGGGAGEREEGENR